MTQDPLDSILAQASEQDTKAQKLRTSLGYGLDQNPEAAVKAQRVASKMKTTPAYAQGNLPALQKAVALDKFDYDAFIRSSPQTASWASNPDNAAIAHDDLEHLSNMEGQIKAMSPWESFRFRYIDPAVRQLQEFPLTRAALGVVGGSVGVVGNLGSAVGIHGDNGGRNALQQFQHSLDPSVTGAATVKNSVHLPFDTLAQNLGPMVPATVMSGGTSLLANALNLSDKASKVMSGLAMGGMFTADQAGSTYTEMKQRGASDEQARTAALKVAGITALPNAAFGLTPFSKFLSDNPYVSSVVMGSLQGAGGQVAQNATSDRPIMEGVPGAAVHGAAFQFGLHGGMEFAGQFGQLAKMAEASKLRERMPEKFRELVSSQLGGSGAETALVPPDRLTVFFQEHNLRPESLGPEVAKNYEEALATGGKVAIPMADLLSAKLEPAHYEALAPDVTFKQDQISPREFQEGLKEMQEAAQKGEGPLADLTKEVDAETQAAPEFQAIKEDLKGRYVAAGESPAVAETYATDMAKVFHVLAQREGMNPSELFAQYAPKIIRGEAPKPAEPSDVINEMFTPETFPAEGVAWQEGQDMFFQSAYHGSPYRFDKFSLEHMGKGEGAQAYGWGLYFAGNKEVAEYYREQLTNKKGYKISDGRVLGRKGVFDNYLDRLANGEKAEDIILEIQEPLKDDPYDWGKTNAKGFIEGFIGKTVERLDKGQTYQVDIPDDGAYLLWDKPLSEQPEAVKKFAQEHGITEDKPGALYRQLHEAYIREGEAKPVRAKEEQLSKDLAKAGVPGIKYMDGTSRSAGEGNFNYVIFDDAAVNITQTFYQSGIDPTAGRPDLGPLYQPQHNDFSFGSKKWQEYYRDRLGKNARAKGDRANRAMEGLKWAESQEGQAAFNYERNAAAQAEEDAFLRFDKAVSRIQQPRGWFRRTSDGAFEIGKTPEGDFSTFIHEPAHAYLEMFGDLAKREGASEGLKTDSEKILKFLGVDSWEKIGTPEHELWARANEAYCREGKAPTPELRGVFQRFKVWLQSVYRHVSELDAPLNDDIRGVFDRMRATDAEIEAAHADIAGPQIFKTAEEAGMTEREFRSYAIEKGMSMEDAKAEMLAKFNEAAIREKGMEWKREENEVRGAVSDMIDAKPEYRAIRVLRKGALEDGTEFKLDRKALVEQFGDERVKEMQKAHPNLYRKEGGMDAEAAAEILGFGSGEDMMQAMEGAPKRSESIRAETQRIMTERHGDIRYDGTIEDQARLAVQNDALARGIHREFEALKRKADGAKEALGEAKTAARAALSIPPLQSFREAAVSLVESKPIRDLDANAYLNNQRKYSREAYKNATQGKYQKAAEAKQKELLNHFLYLEAVKGKAESEKIAAYGRKGETGAFQARLGKAGGEYQAQWNALASRYEFAKVTNKELDARSQSLEAWAEAQKVAGEGIVIDPALYREDQVKNWREIPLTELRAVRDGLKNIETLARRQNEVLNGDRAADFETAVQELDAGARGNLKSKPLPVDPLAVGAKEKIAHIAKAANTGIAKFERVIDHLDQGDINGPWRRYIFEPLCNAQFKEFELNQKVTTLLGEAMESMPKEQRHSMLDIYDIPGIGKVTRKFVLSMALNMGNESNQTKMLKGMGWAAPDGMEAVGKALDKLNRTDWEFVQKTWDAIDTLWPEIADLQRKMTGVEPPRVERRAFSANLADGSEMKLDGGYYPVAYDRSKSSQGAMQADRDIMNSEGGFQGPVTFKGHTEERTEFAAPLNMDFEQVLTRHVAQVIKDLSHREAAMSVSKLIRNQEVRAAISETMGSEYEAMFMPWLKGTVNDVGGQTGADVAWWKSAMMTTRSNMVLAGLSFRAGSVLVQATDLGRAAMVVKPRHLGQALLDFGSHPIKMTQQARELSKEMRGRSENLDRDTRDMMKRMQGKDGAMVQVQKLGMEGLAVADTITSVTTWHGAYQQALADGKPQEQAVRVADRTVRLTMMSSAPKDLVAVQRVGDVGLKFVTMFMGDATSTYGMMNEGVRQIALNRSPGAQVFKMAMVGMVLPLLGQLIKNRGPQDEDDKVWWMVKNALLSLPSSIPIVRDIAQSLDSGQDYKFTPVANAIDKARKAAISAGKFAQGEGDWDDAFMKTFDAAGTLGGIPGTSQAMTTTKYLRDVSTGKQQPENAYEFTKNAIFGPPPKPKK